MPRALGPWPCRTSQLTWPCSPVHLCAHACSGLWRLFALARTHARASHIAHPPPPHPSFWTASIPVLVDVCVGEQGALQLWREPMLSRPSRAWRLESGKRESSGLVHASTKEEAERVQQTARIRARPCARRLASAGCPAAETQQRRIDGARQGCFRRSARARSCDRDGGGHVSAHDQVRLHAGHVLDANTAGDVGPSPGKVRGVGSTPCQSLRKYPGPFPYGLVRRRYTIVMAPRIWGALKS